MGPARGLRVGRPLMAPGRENPALRPDVRGRKEARRVGAKGCKGAMSRGEGSG